MLMLGNALQEFSRWQTSKNKPLPNDCNVLSNLNDSNKKRDCLTLSLSFWYKHCEGTRTYIISWVKVHFFLMLIIQIHIKYLLSTLDLTKRNDYSSVQLYKSSPPVLDSLFNISWHLYLILKKSGSPSCMLMIICS